jgi:hypothetical protein
VGFCQECQENENLLTKGKGSNKMTKLIAQITDGLPGQVITSYYHSLDADG